MLAFILVVAALLRLYALDRYPPGLYRDEAYNGLDALAVLEGNTPLFFEANNGREPLFIYLQALSVALLGRTPFALRLPAAVLGSLTVLSTYGMAKALFDRRIALLAAAIAAITFWAVNLSRVGLRPVAFPLLASLFLWQWATALHTQRLRHFVVAGLLAGLTLYTYTAARMSVPFIVLFIVYLWVSRSGGVRRGHLAIFVAVAVATMAPLGLYFLIRGLEFFARPGQVSIFNPDINHGDLWGSLTRSVVGALLMFTTQGDFIPRHNLPYRPVFDPLMALFFLVGIGWVLGNSRRSWPSALILLWTVTMLLPTLLAEGAPHFLRGSGVLPVVFVYPALGMAWAYDRVRARSSTIAATLLGASLVISATLTSVDYFVRHAPSETAYFNFETGASELAVEINRFLGSGWDGRSLWADEGQPYPGRAVYLAVRLWENFPSMRYLVPALSSFHVLEGGETPRVSVSRALFVLWPFEGNRAALRGLPASSLLRVRAGALERGDLEKSPRLLYVAYEASPAPRDPQAIARFGEAIELLDYEIAWVDLTQLQVRLVWRARQEVERDYTVFVHLLRDGAVFAQVDGPPAQGYYGTGLWRPGDVIEDERSLALAEPLNAQTDRLVIGFYLLDTLERLPAFDVRGQPLGDSLNLDVVEPSAHPAEAIDESDARWSTS
ncbi:MAG: glycosyltransferase family 39 protein [Chloroflexi bacterium]|nr:glycosyltransferase family 39 protein [Chloroflexota bacterium]